MLFFKKIIHHHKKEMIMKKEDLMKIINAIKKIREQRQVNNKNYHQITKEFLSEQREFLTDMDLKEIISTLENDEHIVSAVIKSAACSHEMALNLLKERLFPEILCQIALEAFNETRFSQKLLNAVRTRHPRRFHTLLSFAKRRRMVDGSYLKENDAKDVNPQEALSFLQNFGMVI
jgi:hypothetical protein